MARERNLDIFEVIRTTRAMRRLDPKREVSDADLRLVLDAARHAPSGGNSQPVRWVVVRDPAQRRRVGEVYRAVARPSLQETYGERARSDPATSRLLASALHLADHMADAPVLLIPCAPSRLTRAEGSVYPAIQNLMLAARALGLGTTLTSLHRGDEAGVKAVLGIPDDVDTFAIIPLGYPLGTWGEAKRKPLHEITYWERWGRTRDDL